MAAFEVTTPDSIAKLTTSGPASLVQESQTQGDSIQAALSKRQLYTYEWANVAAKNAQLGMGSGDFGYQIDIKTTYQYDGAVWRPFGTTPWATWTPTVTNYSLGTGGTASYLYRNVGDKIECRVAITFGTGGGVTGIDPRITLPVSSIPVTSPYTARNGVGSMFVGGSVYPLFVVANNTSATTVLFYGLAPTTSGFTNLNVGVPAAWTSGDSIGIDFSYIGV